VTALDWAVVAVFLVGVLGGGLWFSRRASASFEGFFLSGRSLPWWLAGTSILATSFASDTPLHTTRVIREEGLGGAWFYWAGILTHLVVTFCFARLWRRTGVVTDAQLIELRYSGAPARVLRGTLACFRGLFLEGLTLAWVTLGMVKVVGTVLELPPTVSVLGANVATNLVVVATLFVLVLVYSVSSGLWGVVVTDLIEFVVALGGAVVLAVIGLSRVGGSEGLRRGLAEHAPAGERALDLLPDLSSVEVSGLALAVYLGVLWWANDGIDGSGKRAQRFLACRSERDALGSGIWNVAVQWILRSWPWYVAALVSLVLYPDLADHEAAYPRMMADLLPVGLKGMMVAAFLAAFMSTVDTHLNLSSAYVVNDLYRRFIAPDRSDRHYVRASRVTLVVLALFTGVVALLLPSVLYAFKLKMELVAGLGGVLLLRWLWWRINAWSELTALGTSLLLAVGLHMSPLSAPDDFPLRMLIIVAGSTAAWLLVTLLTRPEPDAQLVAFFRQVGPPRAGWGPVAAGEEGVPPGLGWGALGQAGLCGAFVFCGMFGIGKLVLGEPALGLGLLGVAAGACVALLRLAFPRRAPD